jgi:hypothetical protein
MTANGESNRDQQMSSSEGRGISASASPEYTVQVVPLAVHLMVR